MRHVWNSLILSAVVFGLSACSREVSDVSKISLQLPTYNQTNSVASKGQSALSSSCNPCLKSITVHVDGEEFKTIRFQQTHSNSTVLGSQLDTSVSLEVPGGNNRRIQLLALYTGQSAGSIKTASIQYGSVTVNLQSAEPPPIELKLNKVDNFVPSVIAGRFLTSADAGPTGSVDVIYNHPTSGLELTFPSAEIMNGWFRFPASENLALSYVLNSTKSTLLSKVTSTSLKTSATSKHLVHFTKPKIYYYDAGETNYTPYGSVDIVYGYFSGNPSLLTSKKVCVQNSVPNYQATELSVVFTEADRSSGTNRTLKYHHQPTVSTGPTPDIFATGGDTAANCGSVENVFSYTSDQISILRDQMVMKGNDTAVSLFGAFTGVATTGVVSRIRTEGTFLSPVFLLKGLPGIFVPSGNQLSGQHSFDGIRLFKTSNSVNIDDVRCNEKWLDAHGFSAVALTSLNIDAGNNIAFTTDLGSPYAESMDNYAVCPSAGNALKDIGGMKIGALRRPQIGQLQALNLGGEVVSSLQLPTTYVAETTIANLKLKNIGINLVQSIEINSDLTGLAVDSTDCTSGTVNPAGTCDLNIGFTPSGVGAFSGVITITYARPGAATSGTLTLPFSTFAQPTAMTVASPSVNVAATQVGQTKLENIQVTVSSSNGVSDVQLAIIGTNANEFLVDSTGGLGMGNISPGNYVVGIRYSPTSTGPHSAYLRIMYNRDGVTQAPLMISITATGLP